MSEDFTFESQIDYILREKKASRIEGRSDGSASTRDGKAYLEDLLDLLLRDVWRQRHVSSRHTGC